VRLRIQNKSGKSGFKPSVQFLIITTKIITIIIILMRIIITNDNDNNSDNNNVKYNIYNNSNLDHLVINDDDKHNQQRK
jgi:hypothetical protein